MAKIDQKTVVKPEVALVPTTIGSDTVTNGAIIDTKTFQSITFLLQAGAIAAGVATPSFFAGNESNLSDGATVAAEDLLGTIADATFSAIDDDFVKWIGYRGEFRFIRLDITTTGSTTSTVLSAIGLLGSPNLMPTV